MWKQTPKTRVGDALLLVLATGPVSSACKHAAISATLTCYPFSPLTTTHFSFSLESKIPWKKLSLLMVFTSTPIFSQPLLTKTHFDKVHSDSPLKYIHTGPSSPSLSPCPNVTFSEKPSLTPPAPPALLFSFVFNDRLTHYTFLHH